MQYFLLLVALLWTSATVCAQDNLIHNGQFTTGTAGWSVLLTDKDQPIKAQIEHGASYKEYGLADNFVGTNFVELDAQSAIQQTIRTEPGKAYTLKFAFAHRPEAGKKQLIVMADGKVVYTKTINSASEEGRFTYKEVQFVASSPQTKIGFYAVSILEGADDKGILLTDVWCEPVSEDPVQLGPSDHKF